MTGIVNPRIVLAGSVSFSRVTLLSLLRHNANVVGALGLAESKSANVSDYARLDDLGAPYRDFTAINDTEVVEQVRAWKPDVLFVVGLSQLVKEPLLSMATLGPVGFHPTPLPKGRGRAPIAWLTYDGTPGAATFFIMENDADSGPIFVQEPFDVAKDAYAMDVIIAARRAIERALDRWLPRLIAGEWNPAPQDHSQASFFGVRRPEDGWIDWRDSATEIQRLVRTASKPYPGAFTHLKGEKVVIWRAEVDTSPYRGVAGRVLDTANGVLVQTGDGLLRITEVETEAKISVGVKLG